MNPAFCPTCGGPAKHTQGKVEHKKELPKTSDIQVEFDPRSMCYLIFDRKNKRVLRLPSDQWELMSEPLRVH